MLLDRVARLLVIGCALGLLYIAVVCLIAGAWPFSAVFATLGLALASVRNA